jgi:acyl carrier protein
MALEDKVRDIIVDKLSVTPDQVKPEASIVEDLKADSLDLVELVMELEDAFGAEITEQDQEKLKTVGDVLTFLKSKGIEG